MLMEIGGLVYANVVYGKTKRLRYCVRFIEGTVIRIAGPHVEMDQIVALNGHKKGV